MTGRERFREAVKNMSYDEKESIFHYLSEQAWRLQSCGCFVVSIVVEMVWLKTELGYELG